MRTFVKGLMRSAAARLQAAIGPAPRPEEPRVSQPEPSRPRFPASAEAVRQKLAFGVEYVHVADVRGDVAEFGTGWGVTATALAEALAGVDADIRFDVRRPKVLHLFDSFRGLPRAESEVDRAAPHVASGLWGEGTCHGIAEEELLRMCGEFLPRDRLHTHAGWFRDTLSQLPRDTRLALLHIDCDLYESAHEVLEHCFSRGLVSEGAAVFFDDWSCNRSSPELGERRAWAEVVERYGIRASDCGEYGGWGWKFIVHSYEGMPDS